MFSQPTSKVELTARALIAPVLKKHNATLVNNPDEMQVDREYCYITVTPHGKGRELLFVLDVTLCMSGFTATNEASDVLQGFFKAAPELGSIDRLGLIDRQNGQNQLN